MKIILFILFLALAMSPSQPEVTAAVVSPYPNAPACTSHDDRKFHNLWNYGAGCHWDHIHGDNPHTVDDIFGTGYFATAGGEISYPWQTPDENLTKHETYKWFVRRDLPCFDDFAGGCVKAFRAQVHADMHNLVSDHHSFAMEALVCRESAPNNCGIVRFGGWQFSGDVTIDEFVVHDRTNPPNIPANVVAAQLHHASRNTPFRAIWYVISPNSFIRVSHMTEDAFGYYPLPSVRPGLAPTLDQFRYFCEMVGSVPAPNCKANATNIRVNTISIDLSDQLAQLDPDGDGLATANGYVDRYGAFVSGCSSISLDCIPYSFEDVPLSGDNWFRFASANQTNDNRDYDISFDGELSGWVEFPN